MGGVGSPTSSEFHFTDDKSPPRARFWLRFLVSSNRNACDLQKRGCSVHFVFSARVSIYLKRVLFLTVSKNCWAEFARKHSYFLEFSFFFKDIYGKKNICSNTFLHAAHDRLANRPRGPHNKLRIYRLTGPAGRHLFLMFHGGLPHAFISFRCLCLVSSL